MDTEQFKRFHQEAKAFDRKDPSANAYRAGRYNGYLAGALDTLRKNRRVCFDDCMCEIDKLVDKQLTDHPELTDRPAIEWLVPLLEKTFPCE